jgi:hypothetical protein
MPRGRWGASWPGTRSLWQVRRNSNYTHLYLAESCVLGCGCVAQEHVVVHWGRWSHHHSNWCALSSSPKPCNRAQLSATRSASQTRMSSVSRITNESTALCWCGCAAPACRGGGCLPKHIPAARDCGAVAGHCGGGDAHISGVGRTAHMLLKGVLWLPALHDRIHVLV